MMLKSTDRSYRVEDWILVKFPKEASGRNRKLSQPWHGPYCIISQDDPDLTVSKVYQPQDGTIQIHQSWVMPWQKDIVSGYFWYGHKKHSPGRHPKWLDQLTRADEGDHGDEEIEDDSPVQGFEAVTQSEPDSAGELDTESNRSQNSLYSLRSQTQPPGRLM